MTKDKRKLHTKYRRTYTPFKSAELPNSIDMFPERLDDILPLPHELAEHQASYAADVTSNLEWECAAAAFKQLAYNYSVLLGKTTADCERDLKSSLLKVAARRRDYRTTEFYAEVVKT